jgi:crotonobetainyl-CoA:carnitine CoA-transferase CaiB-like acyl-CoA transferase
LNLTDSRDREVVTAMLGQADVIVQNFTIGVANRLGIDEQSAREQSPNVVYAYLNTFGRQGPWARYRGFAEIANVTTGLSERTTGDRKVESGGPAAVDRPRWIFTDFASGVLGAFAAVLGLFERSRTGSGVVVETSLVRTTALEQIPYMIDYVGRDIQEPRGDVPGWSDLQRLYGTLDGVIFLGAVPTQIDRLLQLVGALDIGSLPDALSKLPTSDICISLSAAAIGVHEVARLSELMKPGGLAEARGIRLEDTTADFGRIVMPGPVSHFSRTPLVAGSLPRPFGTETDEIRHDAAALLDSHNLSG